MLSKLSELKSAGIGYWRRFAAFWSKEEHLIILRKLFLKIHSIKAKIETREMQISPVTGELLGLKSG